MYIQINIHIYIHRYAYFVSVHRTLNLRPTRPNSHTRKLQGRRHSTMRSSAMGSGLASEIGRSYYRFLNKYLYYFWDFNPLFGFRLGVWGLV